MQTKRTKNSRVLHSVLCAVSQLVVARSSNAALTCTFDPAWHRFCTGCSIILRRHSSFPSHQRHQEEGVPCVLFHFFPGTCAMQDTPFVSVVFRRFAHELLSVFLSQTATNQRQPAARCKVDYRHADADIRRTQKRTQELSNVQKRDATCTIALPPHFVEPSSRSSLGGFFICYLSPCRQWYIYVRCIYEQTKRWGIVLYASGATGLSRPWYGTEAERKGSVSAFHLVVSY